MLRMTKFPIALVALVAFAASAAAQSTEREPENIDALWLGEQVAGERLTLGDLEGRVVLAYHWCVS